MHSCLKMCDGLASLLAVRLIHKPMTLMVTIILLGVLAHPQSVPNSQVSANGLVRRVRLEKALKAPIQSLTIPRE